MAAHPPPPVAPRKAFREPAQTASVQCPCCGGPITLKGFGGVEQVACPYCGSELAPQESGALDVLRQVQRQHRQSMIPLHTRGTLEGQEWEVLGIVWRECTVDGVTYPWQEFLLYNPYQGYRWLIYQMSDGHWSLGGALLGAPRSNTGGAHKSVEFKKQRYRHFQTSVATAVYVEGEFPWQIHAGDNAVAHDYILPPYSISIEESQMPDGSADVNFTGMEHIEGAAVWKAFGLPGSPPRTQGVGALRPNPYKERARFMWLTFAGLMVAWLVVAVIYVGGRTNKIVFEDHKLSHAPMSQEITIGTPGDKTTLQFEFVAQGLSNGWAYADVMLVNANAENGIGFGATAEEWHGVSGGESWREGSASETVVIGGVDGGTYLLQITPSMGDASAIPKQVPSVQLSVRIKENIVLARYLVISLLVIILFPVLNAMLRMFYEGRRWQNSDYAPG